MVISTTAYVSSAKASPTVIHLHPAPTNTNKAPFSENEVRRANTRDRKNDEGTDEKRGPDLAYSTYRRIEASMLVWGRKRRFSCGGGEYMKCPELASRTAAGWQTRDGQHDYEKNCKMYNDNVF